MTSKNKATEKLPDPWHEFLLEVEKQLNYSIEVIDLVLSKAEKRVAIEYKASLAPSLTAGFWNALDDINPQQTFVVALTFECQFLNSNDAVWSICGGEA